MAWFLYRALTQAGSEIKGEMEAQSQTAVIDWLMGAGHTPISVIERDAKRNAIKDRTNALKPQERVRITRELASLVNAGVSLERGLQIVSQLLPRAPARQIVKQIVDAMRSGQSFARALETIPGAFPPHYLGLIAAGEASGTLPKNLDRLAVSLERAHQLQERVRSALLYPAVLLAVIGVTFVLIFTVVLPRLAPLFAEAGATLPLPTRIVLALGGVVEHYGWIVLLFLGIASLIAVELSRIAAVQTAFDRFLLGFPPLLGLVQKSETASLSRTLGTLLEAGVSLPAALGRTEQTLRNRAMRKAISTASAGVREGQRLSAALTKTRILPRASLELIRVGEEIAALPQMLLRASDLYEREVETTVDRLVTLLVPALTIGMGLLVGGLVASVLVGIMSLNDVAL